MSETLKDGGPAFPGVVPAGVAYHPGMSLRDWFAGQALASSKDIWQIAAFQIDKDDAELPYRLTAAQACYAIADALLAAREEGR